MGANEVHDALYLATDGCPDAERVRERIMVFVGELPEDMTVQEILASAAIGSDGEGEDDGREILRHTKTKTIAGPVVTKSVVKETVREIEFDDPLLAAAADVTFLGGGEEPGPLDMVPRVGHMVLYKLGQTDVDNIRRDRHRYENRGNAVEVGNVYPMLIVRVWGHAPQSAVNGQAFLDGEDFLWVTSCSQGDGEREFSYPND